MSLRRLAVTGCFLAAALAISACQVRHGPAHPQKNVAAPTRTLPGKQATPGKVVKTPPGQAKHGNAVPPGHGGTPPGQMKNAKTTPPGQNKNAKMTPPGHDEQGKAKGQDKRNAALPGQKGKSKTGPAAAPKGQAKQPGQPARTMPQQPQAGGAAKSHAKTKPADALWKGSQPRPQAQKKVSEPLPPAKGKPTALINKPPKGDEAADDATADQAQQGPSKAPGKSPGAGQGKGTDKGKGKGKQPI